MKVPFTVIFFSVNNGRGKKKPNGNKFGREIQKSNPDGVAKATRKINGLKSKEINQKNMKSLFDYIVLMSKSNTSFKFGPLISSVIDVACSLNDPTMNNSKNLLTTRNQNLDVNNVKYYQTKVTIGHKHSAQINKYKSGPTFEVISRTLHSSLRDSLSAESRKSLYSTHGINQRCFSFIGDKSYLNLGDIKALTDYDFSHQEKITTDFNNVIDSLKSSETDSRFMDQYDRKITRRYAALLESRFCIKITNVLSMYNSNIKIHLVKFNESSIQKDRATIPKLIKDIQYSKKVLNTGDEKSFILERLFPDDLIENRNNPVSDQVITTANGNILQLEAFKSSCTCLRSWKRCLGPNSTWSFDLREIYYNGIYLNKLHELDLIKLSNKTPLSTFICIESIGDRRCAVKRKADNSIFYSQFSPGNHQYEFEHKIKYLANPETSDEIFVTKRKFHNDAFEDPSIGEDYYPERTSTTFNVDFENIDINNRSKNKEYELDICTNGNQLEETTDLLQKFISRISKFDRHEASQVTPDDLEFIANNDDDEEDNNNNQNQDTLDLDSDLL